MRVSTTSQAERGGGLEMQRQRIEAYCNEKGIVLTDSFTDAGISGAIKDTEEAEEVITKREALMELLATVKEGDTIIVLNTSRLWRSDTAKVFIRRKLMKAKVNVIAVENPRFDLYAEDPNVRLMDGIFELLDEYERISIVLKLKHARRAKARTGWKPGGITPFGYRYAEDMKHVEIAQVEAPIVRRMFSLAQSGRSLKQIADALNADGILTRRGNEWSAAAIHAILRNDFYVGVLRYQGKEIPGNHPAIISRVQFGKVGAALERRHR